MIRKSRLRKSRLRKSRLRKSRLRKSRLRKSRLRKSRLRKSKKSQKGGNRDKTLLKIIADLHPDQEESISAKYDSLNKAADEREAQRVEAQKADERRADVQRAEADRAEADRADAQREETARMLNLDVLQAEAVSRKYKGYQQKNKECAIEKCLMGNLTYCYKCNYSYCRSHQEKSGYKRICPLDKTTLGGIYDGADEDPNA